MPLGYKSGSIRSGISLSDEQLNIVLQCMARAVTVRELCEESGLERHTADAIRFKVMYAIAQYQAGIKLENSAVLAFSSVKTSEKGAKVCVLDSKPRLKAIFATDSTGQCIGMAGNPDSVVSGYSPDGYRRSTVDDSVKEWLFQHGITKCTVQSESTRITQYWNNRFILHFKRSPFKVVQYDVPFRLFYVFQASPPPFVYIVPRIGRKQKCAFPIKKSDAQILKKPHKHKNKSRF